MERGGGIMSNLQPMSQYCYGILPAGASEPQFQPGLGVSVYQRNLKNLGVRWIYKYDVWDIDEETGERTHAIPDILIGVDVEWISCEEIRELIIQENGEV